MHGCGPPKFPMAKILETQHGILAEVSDESTYPVLIQCFPRKVLIDMKWPRSLPKQITM